MLWADADILGKQYSAACGEQMGLEHNHVLNLLDCSRRRVSLLKVLFSEHSNMLFHNAAERRMRSIFCACLQLQGYCGDTDLHRCTSLGRVICKNSGKHLFNGSRPGCLLFRSFRKLIVCRQSTLPAIDDWKVCVDIRSRCGTSPRQVWEQTWCGKSWKGWMTKMSTAG